MTKVFILNLGCSKNQADSEDLAGILEAAGCELVNDIESADTAVVNTCGFIRPAVEESLDSIIVLEDLKSKGTLKTIIVAGCMVNRYGHDLVKEFPSVDFWARSEEWERILSAIGKESINAEKGNIGVTTKWSRYLKIGEGCNSRCSFCTIPDIRGPLRSLPPKRVVDQAQELVETGAKEICLVSQDPTMYGSDLAGQPLLKDLLREMGKTLPDDIWIRLHYLNPERIDRELLEIMAGTKNILPYLDAPVQHVNEKILKRMNRKGSAGSFRELFIEARNIDPLFALRTTFITGFPGETEEQFEEILDFLEEIHFDRVGAFPFYPEEGTPAAEMDDAVPEKLREHRYQRLMEIQAEISLKRQRIFEGKKLDVLVEDTDSDPGMAWGRSYRDAPEVDGMVGVYSPEEGPFLEKGQIVAVKVTEAVEHDLFGEVYGVGCKKN